MDAFVRTHTSDIYDGPGYGALTMGYYTRSDLPFHYALADAFTICDNYHCSVLGPTDPNRLMAMSGTIDPMGTHGGPILTTASSTDPYFSANWVTVPELLQDAGVTWKTYQPPGQGYQPSDPHAGAGDASLQYFSQFSSPASALFQNAFLPSYPADFVKDVRAGTLPNVSWIIPPSGFDEHPPSAPDVGAWFIDQLLQVLVSNTDVWSKTVLFVMYDESDGLFDHVAPPVAPMGTAGEYVTKSPLPSEAQSVAGPIGLGFRVPMLVVSPFSRGGYVASKVFDHTSQIRFLEERFGIHCSNISAWRRRTVGDLTSTLNTISPSGTVPTFPATSSSSSQSAMVSGTTIRETPITDQQDLYPLAAVQTMPRQELGIARRLPGTIGMSTVTIGSFAARSAILSTTVRVQVQDLTARIVNGGFNNVALVGFSDNLTTPKQDRAISEARAVAVRGYLISELNARQYPNVNITTTGKGRSSPVGSNATNSGRAKNRRVVALVS